MFLNKWVILLLVMITVACKNTTKQEINSYDELIRNPRTANSKMDTNNIPKLYFPEPVFDFGYVDQGDSIIHEFSFFNRGKAKLLISQVQASCGCTVPKLYKDNLEPGDSSKLKVVFNSKDKESFQERKIYIYANTFPAETVITLTGFVIN